MTQAYDTPNRWINAWPDALAFAVGLGLAWYFQWETRDLVWSLWLSSAVIGYAMIVWSIFGPAVSVATEAWRERENLRGTRPSWGVGLDAGVSGIRRILPAGVFNGAFRRVSFRAFGLPERIFPGGAWHGEILPWFVPLLGGVPTLLVVPACGGDRGAGGVPSRPGGAGRTAGHRGHGGGDRGAEVSQRQGGTGGGLMAPYKNVVRLHLLIFFFAAAHFAKLDSFIVYAVVYAVYFFPWRLVKRDKV